MRRTSLVAVGLAVALFTAACGGGGSSNDNAAGSDSKQEGKTTAFPVTITQKVAPVTIDKEPVRVVALDFPSADAAIALGVVPVGMAKLSYIEGGVQQWTKDALKGAQPTLVERSTRYVMLVHLPDGKEALMVNDALKKTIVGLPAELMRTLTWDQGSELARHRLFTVDTGVQVYFCGPHSPWQRGSNENTNRLLRQYMPKGTDLSLLGADDLARIAQSLNNRPRKTLGFMKPSEKLAELLAMTG